MSSAATETPLVGDVGAGHTLGRYELLLPIASGGMAMVWAARLKGTRGFQKIVAIKTMLPKLSEDPHFEQMFLDEASLASQIRHSNVVEILDLGEQEHVLYLVMEWIDGVPMSHVIKAARSQGGVPLPIAVRMCIQGLAGLHAAHELTDPKGELVGLVHRDVSPQNLLVTYEGNTKVVDFGVAKATAGGGAGATQAGQIKGKIAYMAPEQVKGQTIDRRVDVFAMGVVLYALTTGKHPFRKDTDAATMYQICSPEPVVAPRRIIPGYPMQLERVLTQALAKNPARRFPTANDFLVALDQALPSSMRVSSDEEVAKFIRSLFSDRREQQKQELQAALERADERARTGHAPQGIRQYFDSQGPPSRASMSGVSGVSGVSEFSLVTEARMAAEGTPSETSAMMAGRPSYHEPMGAPQLAQPSTAPQKSRAPLILALLATVIAITAVALLFASKMDKGQPAAAAPPSPTASAVVPAAASAPAPAASPSATAATTVEPATTATGAGKPTAKKGGGKWTPPTAAAVPTAKSTAQPTGTKPNAGLKVDKVFE